MGEQVSQDICPPYYAVIFTSRLAEAAGDDYQDAAEAMVEEAKRQDGFLGLDSWRDNDGRSITISYWRDEAAIAAWRDNPEHKKARAKGRALWYRSGTLRVAKVERAYSF